ncbi:MAG: LTA synthase family protein [Flavobacteriia bacterium]|nr:LTA synthase family protein [Flavobacteriia bacterium]
MNVIIFSVYYVLIEIFIIVKEPLNEVIFSFSGEEIKTIIGGSNQSLFFYLKIIVLVFLYFFFHFILNKIKLIKRSIILLFCTFFTSFFISFTYYQSEKNIANKIVNNKLIYFIVRSNEYLNRVDNLNYDISKINSDFLGGVPIDPNYPLLHRLASNSEFVSMFNKKSSPPNIVIIILESLSSDFIGKNANNFGNLMPFLDSLSDLSLYFPNVISTSEKTYNVLPAILASTPNSPEYSIFQELEFPNHLSLISILKKKYFSRFYCGVDIEFNKMNNFLKYHKTNYIVHSWEKKFNKNFSKENIWGYPDEDLFNKSIVDDRTIFKNIKKPFLDVFLTISTHYPYAFPNQKYILSQFIDEMKKKNNFRHKKFILNNSKAYSSFRYLDQCLRLYFKSLKKNGKLDNTIFIITGDHGTELFNQYEIDKFKVPIIIYSDLLKFHKRVDAISSHLDILPSLLCLLNQNYYIKMPDLVSFMGSGLRMNNQQKKLNQVISSYDHLNNYLIYKDHFLAKKELFKISDDLKLTKLVDKTKIKYLNDKIKQYTSLSSYCILENKIIPFDLYYKIIYNKKYKFLDYQIIEEISNNNVYNILSDTIHLKDISILKINVKLDYFLKNKKELGTLPILTCSINNKNLSIWKQANPLLIGEFKANSWNKFDFFIEIDLNNLKHHKNFDIIPFLWNNKKLHLNARNVVLKAFYIE